jgi:RND family efflux transporter MFP subunit
MAFWKQTILIAVVVLATVTGWAVYVPAARPWLDRAGLLGTLENLGLVAAATEPGAGSGGGPGGSQKGGPAGSPGGNPGGGGPLTVVAAPPGDATLVTRVAAIGTARGARTVNLAAEISGRIVEVGVGSGDYVEPGKVVVALDSAEAQIVLDRATIMEADARRSFDRLQRLNTSGSATDLQLQEAELDLREAELVRREAELSLGRHRIAAPIAGWVGIIGVETGDLVTPGSALTTIEDRSTLLVDFRVPERVANLLTLGDAIRAAPVAEPDLDLPGRISALDNRVDAASRSLRVQAALPNEGDRLRPGMAIVLTLDATGGAAKAVDPLSIQWAADGAYVWVLRAGKAARVTVRILQRNAGAVLVDADFGPDDLVVIEGVTALRPGTEAVARPPVAAEAELPPATTDG